MAICDACESYHARAINETLTRFRDHAAESVRFALQKHTIDHITLMVKRRGREQKKTAMQLFQADYYDRSMNVMALHRWQQIQRYFGMAKWRSVVLKWSFASDATAMAVQRGNHRSKEEAFVWLTWFAAVRIAIQGAKRARHQYHARLAYKAYLKQAKMLFSAEKWHNIVSLKSTSPHLVDLRRYNSLLACHKVTVGLRRSERYSRGLRLSSE